MANVDELYGDAGDAGYGVDVDDDDDDDGDIRRTLAILELTRGRQYPYSEQQEAQAGHPPVHWTCLALKGGAAQLPWPCPAPRRSVRPEVTRRDNTTAVSLTNIPLTDRWPDVIKQSISGQNYKLVLSLPPRYRSYTSTYVTWVHVYP